MMLRIKYVFNFSFILYKRVFCTLAVSTVLFTFFKLAYILNVICWFISIFLVFNTFLIILFGFNKIFLAKMLSNKNYWFWICTRKLLCKIFSMFKILHVHFLLSFIICGLTLLCYDFSWVFIACFLLIMCISCISHFFLLIAYKLFLLLFIINVWS